MILFDNRNQEDGTVLFAQSAKLINNNNTPLLELKKGLRLSLDKEQNIVKLSFDELLIKIENQSSDKLSSKTSFELYLSEMLQFDTNISKEKRIKMIADYHQRLIWPFFNYVMVFFTLSMVLTRSKDNTSYNIKRICHTFLPLLMLTYFNFSLHKAAYKESIYIVYCYGNILFTIIFSIWKINKLTI